MRPGDLFAALPGTRVHGADFAATALDAGAVAVLTDQAGVVRADLLDHPEVSAGRVALLVHDDPRAALGPAAAKIYGEPSKQLRILGVTGTSGKTTTTYLLESALAAAGSPPVWSAPSRPASPVSAWTARSPPPRPPTCRRCWP